MSRQLPPGTDPDKIRTFLQQLLWDALSIKRGSWSFQKHQQYAVKDIEVILAWGREDLRGFFEERIQSPHHEEPVKKVHYRHEHRGFPAGA